MPNVKSHRNFSVDFSTKMPAKGVIKQTENQFSHLVKKPELLSQQTTITAANLLEKKATDRPNIVPPNFRKALWFLLGNLVKNNIMSQRGDFFRKGPANQINFCKTCIKSCFTASRVCWQTQTDVMTRWNLNCAASSLDRYIWKWKWK